MLRYLAIIALISVGALFAASLAYGFFYKGNGDDETVTVERGGSVAYLKGGDDRFTGAKGKRSGGDHVRGGRGDDLIRTFGRVDVLRGGPGADDLRGGGGPDALHGADGPDHLVGGAGVDRFRPGKGHDTCVGKPEDVGFPNRCEVAIVAG